MNGGAWILLLLLPLASCQDHGINSYWVPKETSDNRLQTMAPPRRDIEWDVPEGWAEKPAGSMRAGSFRVPGAGGREADVSIVPLAGPAGGDLANVNRWRRQVGLDPISQEELNRQTRFADIAGRRMRLVDLNGADGKRIFAAIYRRDGQTWFFKMSGDKKTVEEARPAFDRFLRSVRFRS